MHYIILTGSPSMKQAENIECREIIIDCYSEADSKTLIGEQLHVERRHQEIMGLAIQAWV
jgi:hypothetical protein